MDMRRIFSRARHASDWRAKGPRIMGWYSSIHIHESKLDDIAASLNKIAEHECFVGISGKIGLGFLVVNVKKQPVSIPRNWRHEFQNLVTITFSESHHTRKVLNIGFSETENSWTRILLAG